MDGRLQQQRAAHFSSVVDEKISRGTVSRVLSSTLRKEYRRRSFLSIGDCSPIPAVLPGGRWPEPAYVLPI
jgi:hypothetical protein